MKNFCIIILFAVLLLASACTKSEIDITCATACSGITPSTTVPQISSLELEGGMYYGNLDQKKKGTPDDWIHVLAGTRSSSWRSPEIGKNYECDCDK